MLTQKSHDHLGYHSWFEFSIQHAIIHGLWSLYNNEDGSMCNRCACTQSKTPEQPSLHKASSRQSNINVTIQMKYKLIFWCLNLYLKIWYKSKKAFGLWIDWYYTTRGLVNGYLITCPDRIVIMYSATNLLIVYCHSYHRPLLSWYKMDFSYMLHGDYRVVIFRGGK